MKKRRRVDDALNILGALGLPPAQQNERSAFCLLALLNLQPGMEWSQAESPLMGITPIMDWVKKHYGKKYAPNTRETFRRETMHQFVEAGLALPNPDDPARPVNSPNWVYQIEPDALNLLRVFGNPKWNVALKKYLDRHRSLVERYADERNLRKIPVRIAADEEINLSSGKHSELIRAIIEEFCSRFVPGGELIYVGDTKNKWGYFDSDLLSKLGVFVDRHGKMPDVVVYYQDRNWLLLAESATSHGPIGGKRHGELKRLFSGSSAEPVYLTAFPDKAVMARYISQIAWGTEVWVAEQPSHLIHFNGGRFFGPHS